MGENEEIITSERIHKLKLQNPLLKQTQNETSSTYQDREATSFKKQHNPIEETIHKKIDYLLKEKDHSSDFYLEKEEVMHLFQKLISTIHHESSEEQIYNLICNEFDNNRYIHIFTIFKKRSNSKYIFNASLGLQNFLDGIQFDILATMDKLIESFQNQFNTLDSFLLELFQKNELIQHSQTEKISNQICYITPIKNKNNTGFLGITMPRKDAELSSHLEYLSQHIQLRIKQVQIGKDKQNQAAFDIEPSSTLQNKNRTNLTVNLSHDLRNSLNPLLNLLPILIKTKDTQSEDKIIQVIEQNVLHIQKLVEKVKQIAYLKSSKTLFSKKPINIDEVMDQNIYTHFPEIQQKQLQIKKQYTPNIIIEADPEYINMLLSHILQNAIQFTPKEGVIDITITKKNDFIFISIQDTGLGMSQNQIKHAFDEFYKADESRQNLNRNGLGLPICKYITEKHNGEIWMESPGINKGTTVHIKFHIPQIST